MENKFNEFKNKKVLIWGLGLHNGGLGATKFFHKIGSKVTVTDLRSELILKPTLTKLKKYSGIKYVLGKHNEKDFLNADLVIVNPAITPNNKFLKLLKKNKIEYITDMGFFLKYNQSFIVGVTGTKGKSTITQLSYNLLKEAVKNKQIKGYNKVVLGGNIRKSILDFLSTNNEKTISVIELSSFQLEYIKHIKKSPNLAIFTNLSPEHINWHGTYDNYIKSKSYIYKFQKKEDYLIIDNRIDLKENKPKSKIIKTKSDPLSMLKEVAKIFNLKTDFAQKIFNEFPGLPGRLEELGTINGITFINDTFSTHPLATAHALNKIKDPVLIMGGVDKQFNLTEITKTLMNKKTRVVFLPGTFTDNLQKLLKPSYLNKYTVNSENMEDAFKKALLLCKKNDILILSPGGASFNLFLNEVDRGEHYIKCFKKYKKQHGKYRN
jgi:UDP-N-acetylmuramoylalanine--D-glutamate ligase